MTSGEFVRGAQVKQQDIVVFDKFGGRGKGLVGFGPIGVTTGVDFDIGVALFDCQTGSLG